MKRKNLFAVCAGQFLGIAGIDASLVLVPALLSDMGVRGDAALVSWTGGTQAAALLLSLAATPLWGRLGERWGRGRMLARAHAGLALSLAAMAWSRSPWQLVLARSIQGALAGTTPAALALVSGGCEGSRKMGWVRSAGLAGAFAGPLLGGVLAPKLGAARVMGAAALISAVLAVLVLIEARDEVLAKEPAPLRRAFEPGAFGQAAALSYFRSLEDPLLPVFVRSLASANWTVWAGVCLSASRLAQLALAPACGRAVDRHGAQPVLLPCLAGAGLATAAQAFAPSPEILALTRIVLGACAAGIVAALYARAAQSGEAIAWTSSGLRLGNGLANASAGLAAAALSASGVFALAGAGLLSAAGIVSNRQRREETCAASCSTGI